MVLLLVTGVCRLSFKKIHLLNQYYDQLENSMIFFFLTVKR